MRTREQIFTNSIEAAQPSEPDKYLLRLLKVELLAVELLTDIRDVMIEIRDQKKDIVVDFVPPDYGKEDE